MKKLTAVLSLLLIVAFASLACSGGSDHQQGGPFDRASLSIQGNALPTGGTLDLNQATARLDDVKSFRFDLSFKTVFTPDPTATPGEINPFAGLLDAFGNISACGSIVAPNSSEVTLNFLGQDFGYIQIGDRAWQKEGPNWEVAEPDTDTDMEITPTDLFTEVLPTDVLEGATVSKETVKGVAATRYSFDKAALASVADELGKTASDLDDVDEATMDVWLNASQVPVRLLMNLKGKDDSGQDTIVTIEMNIRDINDASITIKPPI